MLYYNLAIFCIAYYVYIAIHRLLLSPISKFPGPRLAALTWWYEFYYDVIKVRKYLAIYRLPSTLMTISLEWTILQRNRAHAFYIWYEFLLNTYPSYSLLFAKQLTSQIGPIVRINPSEVHIKDPTWYSELNASAPRIRDRPSWYPTPIADGSTASTVQHALHRHRRAALSPFFSKAGVTSFSSLILSRVDLLCARFAEKAGTGAVMHLNMVFTALTLDVISYYSFGDAMGLLEDGEFKVAQEWKKMFEQVTQAGVFMRHFPLVPRVVNSLPYRLVMFLFPSIASFKRFETVRPHISFSHYTLTMPNAKFKWRQAVRHKTTMTLSNSDVGTAQSSKSTQRTIFEELRDSDLPPEEKSISRLTAEALTLIGAGSETTATTLATLTFHLLSTPRVLQKLTAELDAAIPDVRSPPPLQELEQLPYLVRGHLFYSYAYACAADQGNT